MLFAKQPAAESTLYVLFGRHNEPPRAPPSLPPRPLSPSPSPVAPPPVVPPPSSPPRLPFGRIYVRGHEWFVHLVLHFRLLELLLLAVVVLGLNLLVTATCGPNSTLIDDDAKLYQHVRHVRRRTASIGGRVHLEPAWQPKLSPRTRPRSRPHPDCHAGKLQLESANGGASSDDARSMCDAAGAGSGSSGAMRDVERSQGVATTSEARRDHERDHERSDGLLVASSAGQRRGHDWLQRGLKFANLDDTSGGPSVAPAPAPPSRPPPTAEFVARGAWTTSVLRSKRSYDGAPSACTPPREML